MGVADPTPLGAEGTRLAAAIDPGLVSLQSDLLEILGGDRSLQEAAAALHASLIACFPGSRPALEIVRSPIELSVELAPTLPAAFVAAVYPMLLSARQALPAARAVTSRQAVYDELGGRERPAGRGRTAVEELLASFGIDAVWSAPALRQNRALGAVSLYFEGAEGGAEAGGGEVDGSGSPVPGAAAGVAPGAAAAALLERHAALWALCIEGVLRGRAVLADVRSWRQDLAAEIHDDALQGLIAVDLRLQRLTTRLAEPVFSQLLAEVRATCSDAVGGLRAMLARLEPASDAIAAQPAVLVERLATASLDPLGVQWRVHDELEVAVRPATGQLLAAVLTELVVDCTRPPRPTEVELHIGGDYRRLEVRVRRRPGVGALDASVPTPDAAATSSPAGREDHRRWAAARALCSLSGGTFSAVHDGAESVVTIDLPLLG